MGNADGDPLHWNVNGGCRRAPPNQGYLMERFLTVAGGQLGAIARNESRQQVVSRLLELMHEAKARGSDIVVFPELALTTFFPRWWMDDEAELDSFFEREMPSPATRPLFETAKSLGIGFYLGYAEFAKENGATHRYNTAILVDKNAEIVGKYRKVHLPGHRANSSPAAASSRRPVRSSRRRPAMATRSSSPNAISTSAASTRRRCSILHSTAGSSITS